ncbi:MAG: dihydrolipoyl dehydrogenase [Eubacteriaceae bacterium]|nr:dihydrolipoyl dehydrogenase [Eubacteriaceae bacterium]MBR5995404.1 dihydrolipoyl dehydrogenase [Eubacteriaceae bacterium]
MKIAVLGAGPGGYEAAIYAAKRGAEVVLIEKATGEFGGTCLNRGCIPTKAFLASYDTLETVENAKDLGININGDVTIDFKYIQDRKKKVVSTIVNGVAFLMKKNKVTVVNGFGKLVDRNTIDVTKDDGTVETVKADYIIIATGSVPTTPATMGYNKKRIITSDEILDFEEAPKSMILIGGGVIGVEIGQFFGKMGTEVTVVQGGKQLLPTMDEDVAKQLQRQFKKDKINVVLGERVKGAVDNGDNVTVSLESGKELTADYALVAIGRRPFTEGCGFEEAGVVMTDKGRVKVNEFLQTNYDNVYSIGDVSTPIMLAHVASWEGILAVDNIFGAGRKVEYHAVPSCVFTNPEIAQVGETEASLQAAGKEYKVGKFDFKGLGKAIASGHTAGFVKVITDMNDVLIGAAIVGARATDMMQVLTNGVFYHQTATEIGAAIYPHPTMGEAVMEALHDLHGLSINKG